MSKDMTARNHTHQVVLAFLAVAIASVLAFVVLVADPGAAQSVRANKDPHVLGQADKKSGNSGRLSAAQRRAITQGYLVPDQTAYERAKAGAAQKAEQLSGQQGGARSVESQAPTSIRSWQGVFDGSVGPSDSTGAVGLYRYIETVNEKFAIYSRTSNTPVGTGSLHQLAGVSTAESVFDPQIIWDPTTKRFFYAMDDVVSATDNYLAFGFSKTASPSSAADFCKYYISYGSEFPDYPKLGDTSNLLLIGANVFDTAGSYVGSDLISVTKPPSGNTCPAAGSFTADFKLSITDVNGARAFTPVPANQSDTSTAGYVVARSISLPASFLTLYKVSKNADGTMNLGAPRSVTVPSYSIPSNAPQLGVTKLIDTADARNTQAVSAIDPSRGTSGKLALWTQHTVFGGSGAQVRWYEINPASAGLFQKGTLTNSNGLYYFNAAVSPDRVVKGTTKKYGNSMVMGFNSSSSGQRPDIRMVSKIGSNAVSGQWRIQGSPASLNDFTCQDDGICRWGDYSAATPDPGAPTTGSNGQVWLTNQWVRTAGSSTSSGWGTWNWAAKP